MFEEPITFWKELFFILLGLNIFGFLYLLVLKFVRWLVKKSDEKKKGKW